MPVIEAPQSVCVYVLWLNGACRSQTGMLNSHLNWFYFGPLCRGYRKWWVCFWLPHHSTSNSPRSRLQNWSIHSQWHPISHNLWTFLVIFVTLSLFRVFLAFVERCRWCSGSSLHQPWPYSIRPSCRSDSPPAIPRDTTQILRQWGRHHGSFVAQSVWQ